MIKEFTKSSILPQRVPVMYSLATCLALALVASPLPTTADVFVDQAAANCAAGTGTAADPVCTVSEAILIAAPGDTIHIAPGTYNENFTVGKDLELIGTQGDELTIIQGLGTESVIYVNILADATIKGLTVTGGYGYNGGGILVHGTLVLENSTITDNRADFDGAHSLGSAYGSAGGGGLACGATGASLTVRDCSITNNRADNFQSGDSAGGVFVFSAADLTMSGCTISGNDGFRTGGILFRGKTLNLSNTTISGNTSYHGPVAFVVPTDPGSLLSNVTITDNFALYGNGGLTSTQISIQNSIIADNVNLCCGAYYDLQGSITSLGNNLIGVNFSPLIDGVNGDQVGSVAMPLDPQLGPLQDNGGPTLTHALLPSSSAIDAGNAMNFEATDQRGVGRPVGARADIGAFEFTEFFAEFCNGDGGDQMGCTACPCMNESTPGTIGGCLNSSGNSARLIGSGSASISLPPMSTTDLRFAVTGAPAGAFCILNSGDAVAPTNPMNPCFGMDSGTGAAAFDGLRCAVQNTRRHGGRSTDSNGRVGFTNSPWGGEGGPPAGIAVAGAGFAAGQTRFFQVINRDDSTLVCMRGLNTTQAIEVLFTP